ncbi:MAG TPA: kelch repeat-containing protein [Thermoplasmata archaeon]|nr:kelch repeat-containing protein [Thermoplasmata archaeon]
MQAHPPSLAWYKINVSGPPASELGWMIMANSPPDKGLVLFSSSTWPNIHPYTWIFAKNVWTNLTPRLNRSPPARTDAGFVYDASDGYDLLFGGYNPISSSSPFGFLNDTWAFANGSWTQIRAPSAPAGLDGFGMTYDARDGYVVLFGGCCAQTGRGNGYWYTNETWTYHAGKWTRVLGAPHPYSRFSTSLTYDVRDGGVVLYGGVSCPVRVCKNMLNSTWVFRGGVWDRMNPIRNPGVRQWPGACYDRTLREEVLVGGGGGSRSLSNTWAYAAGNWTNLTRHISGAFPGGSSGQVAFDSTSQQFLILEFNGNLWTLR